MESEAVQSPCPKVNVPPAASSSERYANADPIGEVEDPTPVLSAVSFVEPTRDETFEKWMLEQLKTFLEPEELISLGNMMIC